MCLNGIEIIAEPPFRKPGRTVKSLMDYLENGFVLIESNYLNTEKIEEEDGLSDLLIDPESLLLSFCNTSKDYSQSIVVTISAELLSEVDSVLNKNKARLFAVYRSETIVDFLGLTVVCSVPPLCIVDIGHLRSVPKDNYQLASEVRSLEGAENLGFVMPTSYLKVGFPVELMELPSCPQGFGGPLTHIFKENFFSLDLLCKPGTKIKAALRGTIKEISDGSEAQGCHVANFYHCNLVVIDHGNGLESEYVHLEYRSSSLLNLKVGDVVEKGQVIGTSGNSGFSPAPHLHFQVNLKSTSIPFRFDGDACNNFYAEKMMVR